MLNIPQTFDDTVTKTWDESHSCVIFTVPNSRHETIDVFYNEIMDVYRHWDVERPIYVLVDFSDEEVAMTLYLKDRITKLSDYVVANGIKLHLALIIQNNFIGQVMQIFARALGSKDIYQTFFTDSAQAQKWIKRQQSKASV